MEAPLAARSRFASKLPLERTREMARTPIAIVSKGVSNGPGIPDG
jgi:hypothetical protein